MISERNWHLIRDLLVEDLSTFDIPLIMAENGNHKGKRELYLRHAYEAIELDQDYREKTMEHIFYLWARPVHLESVANEKRWSSPLTATATRTGGAFDLQP